MKRSWSYEELSELDAGNLSPADDASLRRRIDGDSEARRALETLQAIRVRLSQLGQQNFTERRADFSERFRPEHAPATTRTPPGPAPHPARGGGGGPADDHRTATAASRRQLPARSRHVAGAGIVRDERTHPL
jgi:hypothetical protein